jgi:hypothetical protein
MLERVYYRCGNCLVCALALLIAAMTSPYLPSCTGSMAFQIFCLMRNDSTPATPSTRHCFRSTPDGILADYAIGNATAEFGREVEFGREAENEKEEECFVGVTGSVSYLIGLPLSTSLKRPAKQAKAFGLMQSTPMLRC